MKIQFRTSGGRGEYEVAGSHGPYSARDLINHDLHLDLGIWGVKISGVYVREDSGKTRLRLRPEARTHLARQLAGALMMPRMVRSTETGGAGAHVMLDEQYSFRALDCASVGLTPTTATLAFGDMIFNNDVAEDRLRVAERVARVAQLHEAAARYPTPLTGLLTSHRELVAAPGPYSNDLEAVVEAIMAAVADRAPDDEIAYLPGSDPLTALEAIAALPRPQMLNVDLTRITLPEVRRRETQERRLVAARSAGAHAFSRDTRVAYDHTCLFCGLRLPQGNLRRGGVDGMHILGHADYDMNFVSNGLCGCKLDHWAFDEGIIMLEWLPSPQAYAVRVTALGATELHGRELDRFKAIEGHVGAARLPADRNKWPAPTYLALYNELMGNTPADPLT